ncbi:uncharacterized protein TERG_12339 [Trichophyton rubrum CBS 118892]|uniref:Uncharacterized protein n=1 Tax=Trichophyton rubrum (strain ATCC MYA-4607 / CBS 118892) TaxID=559305 RepID=A0A080WMK2_TRIRC|nr:uncharacterized protein TERG_12339 [Trichophyton rubrum CBS 118892]KFL62072.1 hypothetical protein TERG_12339 [Trichophyton rubrum CBS 118892]
MENGEEHFLDTLARMLDSVPEDAAAHGWSVHIAKEPSRMLQQWVECLIFGNQHGLTLPDDAPRRRVGAEHFMSHIKQSINILMPEKWHI